MNLKGCRFTWASNPRQGKITKERLDRILVNWSWRSVFQNAYGIALPLVSSDHSPIVLFLKAKSRGAKQFKFEAYWVEHEECHATIKEAWDNTDNENQENNSWQILLQKKDNTKRALSEWHTRTFQRDDKEIERLKERIQIIQNSSNSEDDWNEVKFLQGKIKDLWKQEEIYWNQRSRIKWLNWGDQNTKFFHASTVQRRERNRIERIKNDQGAWVEGQAQINLAVHNFFKNIYTASDC